MALGSEDLGTACGLMTDSYRSSLEFKIGGEEYGCESLQGSGTFGSPALKGLEVSAISVDDGSATATFSGSSVVVDLEDVGGVWQVSSVGTP